MWARFIFWEWVIVIIEDCYRMRGEEEVRKRGSKDGERVKGKVKMRKG